MRLIDAKSAKEALECTLVGDAAALAQRVIDRMPTIDAVPVVRCWECKHYEPCEGGRDFCCLHRIGVVKDDFCSCGKREDGAE